MKKNYVSPEIETIVINTRDILISSPLPDDLWTDDY